MLHSTSALYLSDDFDDLTSSLAEDDILLKQFIAGDMGVSIEMMRAALKDAKQKHGKSEIGKIDKGNFSYLASLHSALAHL